VENADIAVPDVVVDAGKGGKPDPDSQLLPEMEERVVGRAFP
jgi:hypothetical protein